ncbi:hypothetical protein WI40_13960 [Burkholderia ubonensis]|uniref:hypothetical protein n=1 Tax=Burkholderia ubonensis TaxID=101571 RepID=UPI00075A4387|nr:hypothetical protein [Burkholderia ubonensis]KUZ98105.1 hypothetical protein WI40_13960 [Burkholderia ubonensis]
MKMTFENFGRALIVRFEDAAGPLKMVIGGNEGMTIFVDASGNIIVNPPEGPGDGYQQVMELMRIAKSALPTAGPSPFVSTCEALYARIAATENEIAQLESYGLDPKGLKTELLGLMRAANSGRCLHTPLEANPED